MKKVLLIKTKHTTQSDFKENVIKVGTDTKPTSTTTMTTTTPAATTLQAQSSQTKMKIMQVSTVKSMPMSKNIYEERKSQKSAYSDLFTALFRLPDKQVQERVLYAINGQLNAAEPGRSNSIEALCYRCKGKLSNDDTKFVNNGTQTTESFVVENCKKFIITKENHRELLTNGTTKPSLAASTSVTTARNGEVESNVHSNERKNYLEQYKKLLAREEPVTPRPSPLKRGRKRRICVPQVVKESHAQQVQQEREDRQLTPIVQKKRKVQAQENNSDLPAENDKNKNKNGSSSSRRNSNLYEIDLDGIDFDLIDIVESTNQEDYIQKKLTREFWKSELWSEDGLLPIHSAILKHDIFNLQRQIFVWTKMKSRDLNNVLTAADEDCLELAVTNDCIPEIMSVLLRTDLALNNVYENSNNVVHLAIINNIDLNCLSQLMEVVDLSLLLHRNDEGYTPLHIAVRHNLYKSAEVILDKIDKRKLGSQYYKRNEKELILNEDIVMPAPAPKEPKADLIELKKFAKFYEISCDQLEIQLQTISLTNLNFKRRFLDMGESRGGSTALLYTVENEMEHFTYLLLAHLSNPTTENHSGQSAKSFHYEFARTLQLSLKVARSMDKIVALLVKYFNKQI